METALARYRIEIDLTVSLRLLDAYGSDRGVEGDGSPASRGNVTVHPIHVAAGREASPTGISLTRNSWRLEECRDRGYGAHIDSAIPAPEMIPSLQAPRVAALRHEPISD
ncbi:hypothetical protein MMC22_003067 [Lobaria immixta]|nr:hypothetical protein [Lobaria immixta]